MVDRLRGAIALNAQNTTLPGPASSVLARGTPFASASKVVQGQLQRLAELVDGGFARDPQFVGLYPVHCCINHSCAPNALVCYSVDAPWRWVKTHFHERAYSEEAMVALPLHHVFVCALREIKPGEEIRISYIDETLPVEARRRALKLRYLFDCSCARCVADAAGAAGAAGSGEVKEEAEGAVASAAL
jgi:hypothetical protein